MTRLFGLALVGVLLPVLALADVPGPINAVVVSVYDGDTFTADANPWAGPTQEERAMDDAASVGAGI